MAYQIKCADVVSGGLLLTFANGREAFLDEEEVLTFAEQSGAFKREAGEHVNEH